MQTRERGHPSELAVFLYLFIPNKFLSFHYFSRRVNKTTYEASLAPGIVQWSTHSVYNERTALSSMAQHI